MTATTSSDSDHTFDRGLGIDDQFDPSDESTGDEGPFDGPEDGSDDGTDESTAGARRSTSANRVLVRRVAHKTYELTQIDKRTLTLVGHLLGVAPTVPDVAIAIFTAQRSVVGVAKDLNEIHEASDMEAAVLAMTLGRDRMRAVWSLLEHISAAKGSMSNVPNKAAVQVATAVKGLSPSDLEKVRDAVALTRKS